MSLLVLVDEALEAIATLYDLELRLRRAHATGALEQHLACEQIDRIVDARCLVVDVAESLARLRARRRGGWDERDLPGAQAAPAAREAAAAGPVEEEVRTCSCGASFRREDSNPRGPWGAYFGHRRWCNGAA